MNFINDRITVILLHNLEYIQRQNSSHLLYNLEYI